MSESSTPQRKSRRLRKPPDPQIASNIAEARRALDMTQAQLAEAMNERGRSWHQQTVGKIESATRRVSVDEMGDLGEILQANILKGTDLQEPMAQWADRHAVMRARHMLQQIQDSVDELQKVVDVLERKVK